MEQNSTCSRTGRDCDPAEKVKIKYSVRSNRHHGRAFMPDAIQSLRLENNYPEVRYVAQETFKTIYTYLVFFLKVKNLS